MPRKQSAIDPVTARLALYEQEKRHRDQRESTAREAGKIGDLPDPQAVLVFAKVDRGWRLYASREIPHAGFDVRSGSADGTMSDPSWGIDAIMKNMLVITMPTQGECLAEVSRLWANRDRAAAEGERDRINAEIRKAITS